MTVTLRTAALRVSAVVALSGLGFVHCGGGQKTADAPTETIPSAEPPPAEEADAATTRNSPSMTEPASSAQASADPAPAAPASKPEPLSDHQIAAVTDAANTAEITQAKLAQSKAKDPAVKRFAAMMVLHHGQAQQKQAKLKLKLEESSLSTTLQADAASTLNALKAAHGKDFDRVYITAQVDEHQKVLDTLTEKLLPDVKNADLKTYLEEVKSRVEQHLAEAKQLQQSFDGKSADDLKGKHAG